MKSVFGKHSLVAERSLRFKGTARAARNFYVFNVKKQPEIQKAVGLKLRGEFVIRHQEVAIVGQRFNAAPRIVRTARKQREVVAQMIRLIGGKAVTRKDRATLRRMHPEITQKTENDRDDPEHQPNNLKVSPEAPSTESTFFQ